MAKEFCGVCGKEFKNSTAYSKHICEETGFKPIEQEHLGDWFKKQSENALKRGELRKLNNS